MPSPTRRERREELDFECLAQLLQAAVQCLVGLRRHKRKQQAAACYPWLGGTKDAMPSIPLHQACQCPSFYPAHLLAICSKGVKLGASQQRVGAAAAAACSPALVASLALHCRNLEVRNTGKGQAGRQDERNACTRGMDLQSAHNGSQGGRASACTSQISSGAPQGWRAWQTSWRHSVRQWPPPAARAQKKGGSVRSCTNSWADAAAGQRHQE